MQVAALPRWARQAHAREHGDAAGPIRVCFYSSAGGGRAATAVPATSRTLAAPQAEQEAPATAPQCASNPDIMPAADAPAKQALPSVPEAGSPVGIEAAPGPAVPSPEGGGHELVTLRRRQEQLEAMLQRIASASPQRRPLCVRVWGAGGEGVLGWRLGVGTQSSVPWHGAAFAHQRGELRVAN